MTHSVPTRRSSDLPLPGDNSCVEPPDPIPNSEVKLARADGSVHLACESRSLPGSLPRNPAALAAGFLFVRWFFLFQDSAGCLPGAGELAAEAAPAGFGYFAARSPGAARDRGQSTVGGSPPTMTTSAGRRANRPTLTTPGIWLSSRSSTSGSVMDRPCTSRIQLPLSVSTPSRQTGCAPVAATIARATRLRALGMTSTGSGNLPSTSTSLLGSMMQTNL